MEQETLRIGMVAGEASGDLLASLLLQGVGQPTQQPVHDMQGSVQKEVKDKAPIVTSYSVTYEYYYKNKTSDLPNVTTMTSKWVNDTLQELKLVPNDNVQYLVQELHKVAGKDAINPRVEITIKDTNIND